MDALKEKYYQTSAKNLWKLKEYQILNNLRALRQIGQLQYEEQIKAHPEIYIIDMRSMTDEDDILLMLSISDAIQRNMAVEELSSIFGVWAGDILEKIRKHCPERLQDENIKNQQGSEK